MPITKVTRTLTNSKFDHVAMVLKLETDPDEVYFVEAVGELGVCMSSWSNYRVHVGKDKFYKRFVFRHVNFDRGHQMTAFLDKFI